MPQEPKLLRSAPLFHSHGEGLRLLDPSIHSLPGNRGQSTVLHQRADPIPIRCGGPDAGAGRNPGIPASRPTLSPDSATLDPGYIGR